MSTKENLAKNTSFYTVALAMQKVLSLLYFIYVARMIGVDGMGKFAFAMGFTTIFAIVLDFGLNQVLIRESAREGQNSQKYLSNILGLKVIGSIIIYGAVAVTINLMGYPSLVKNMVYVAAVVMVIDSFALNYFGVLRGHHRLKFESLSVIINQVLVIIFGVIVIQMGWGLVALVAAYLAGSLFNLIYSLTIVRTKLNILAWFRLDKGLVKEVLKIALPFAIAGIFIRLYSYIDVVLLSKMAGDQAVGYYGVAQKSAFAFQFVGMATVASVYPAFCSYFVKSKEMLGRTFTKVIYYLLVLSLPLAVGIIIIADKVMGPIFGAQYVPSVPALQVLMLAIPLSFIGFPLGSMLNATNRQVINTIILGLTAASSVVLNLILIPKFGYMGSALAVPLSYLVLVIISVVIINRFLQYDKRYLFISLAKIIVSCVAMGGIMMYLKEQMNFIPVIIIGCLVYAGVLIAVKGFTMKDFRQMKNLLFKKETGN